MNLMQQLDKVEQLASSGKMTRLLHHPSRYVNTIAFTKYIYPRTRRGIIKKTRTFFNTEMKVLLPAAADIYLTGGKTHDSEIRLARFMLNNIKEGQTYIDIGAHFGYYTLLASKLVGDTGIVYAFEAAGNTFSILEKNTTGISNIHAFHNAISEKIEMIPFYEFPVLYSEYNSMNIEQFKNEKWIRSYKPDKTNVKAVTLDRFINDVAKDPDFIKIDVEGAEDKIMKGCTSVLKAHAPVIMMEFLSAERNNAPHIEASSILSNYNYLPHIIDKQGMLVQIDDINGYLKKENLESDNIVFTKNNK